jgi:hypothetical protein
MTVQMVTAKFPTGPLVYFIRVGKHAINATTGAKRHFSRLANPAPRNAALRCATLRVAPHRKASQRLSREAADTETNFPGAAAANDRSGLTTTSLYACYPCCGVVSNGCCEVSLTWGLIFELSGVLGAPNEAMTCVSCCAKRASNT